MYDNDLELMQEAYIGMYAEIIEENAGLKLSMDVVENEVNLMQYAMELKEKGISLDEISDKIQNEVEEYNSWVQENDIESQTLGQERTGYMQLGDNIIDKILSKLTRRGTSVSDDPTGKSAIILKIRDSIKLYGGTLIRLKNPKPKITMLGINIRKYKSEHYKYPLYVTLSSIDQSIELYKQYKTRLDKVGSYNVDNIETFLDDLDEELSNVVDAM